MQRSKYVPYIVSGVALFATVIIGISYWGSRTEVENTLVVTREPFVQQVSVSGRVEAANEVDLGFSQSGRIARVLVKEGQAVGQGVLLAEVENGDAAAILLQREAALDRAKAQLDALVRGARPEELSLKESAVSSARAALASANQALADAILSAYGVSDGAIHATVDQFFSNPKSLTPQISFSSGNAALKSQVESDRITVESVLTAWHTRNAAVTLSSDLVGAAVSAQVSLQEVTSFINDISSLLAVSIPTTATPQATLDAYKTSVQTARTSVNSAIATLTAASKAQSAAQTGLVSAERELALTRAGASAEDIRAQAASVKAAEADVLSASSQFSKTQIRAPFAGTVSKIAAKVGATAQPGEQQISVIGSGGFQIETFVPEINISLIKVGDPAVITFDSYGPEVRFDAKIGSIELGETLKDGVPTYKTILVFTQADERIRSGMTANALITTLEKQDVIAIPQRLVVQREGMQVVRVLSGEAVLERTVVTGAVSSTGDIEIVSGLSVGDLLIVD